MAGNFRENFPKLSRNAGCGPSLELLQSDSINGGAVRYAFMRKAEKLSLNYHQTINFGSSGNTAMIVWLPIVFAICLSEINRLGLGE